MSTGDFPAEDFTPERVKANPDLMAHPDVAALVDEAEHWRQAYAHALAAQTEALAILATVRGAVERHPVPCPTERDGGPVTCGWKRAVADVRLALEATHSDYASGTAL